MSSPVDSSTSAMDLLRKITVEVKTGQPVVLPEPNGRLSVPAPTETVDVALLHKLFPHKRPAAMYAPLPQSKRPKISMDSIKCNKFSGLSNTVTPKAEIFIDDEPGTSTSSTSTPSPPGAQRVKRVSQPAPKAKKETVASALSDIMSEPIDEIKLLQKKALETEIYRDTIIAQYYAKKIELLERRQVQKEEPE